MRAVGFVGLEHVVGGVSDLVLEVRARLRASDLCPAGVLVQWRMDEALVKSTFGCRGVAGETRIASAVVVPSLKHLGGWLDELARRGVAAIVIGEDAESSDPDRAAPQRYGNSMRPSIRTGR